MRNRFKNNKIIVFDSMQLDYTIEIMIIIFLKNNKD
jgi:hypothetical protein